MPLVDLIASLGIIAGAHGVGRIDMVENRAGRQQARRRSTRRPAAVRPARGAPGAAEAGGHEGARSVLAPRQRAVRRHRLQRLWFTPLREALDAIRRHGAGARDRRRSA